MFSAVTADSIDRLREAKTLINVCKDTSINLSRIYDDRILMGAVYVLLYGALEYTIAHCVFRAIELLNAETLTLYDVKPTLWGLSYDSDCTRMEMAGSNKKWENRRKLFEHFTKNEILQKAQDDLFPSSNGNIKETQLQRVWDTFGLTSPMFEPGYESVRGHLTTLAEGRMAIAHGDEKASFRGGQKSIDELEDLYNSISRYCSYLVDCFTKYIQNKHYLQ